MKGTKGELRRARKAARAAGQGWNVELSMDGHYEMVRERTPAQERRHERTMDRWARHGGSGDDDHSMDY